jgi:hypothetical protein
MQSADACQGRLTRMPNETTVYRRSPSSIEAQILCMVLLLVGSGLGWYCLEEYPDLDLTEIKWQSGAHLQIITAITFTLVGGVGLVWSVGNRLAGVALVVDENGLTDHRGGYGIRWRTVRSMDAEVRTVNGSVKTAKLVLYVGTTPAQTNVIEVSVGGLDQQPMEIVQRVKLMWLRSAPQG